VISNPGFKVTRYSRSYYRTLIGSHMRSVERWHFQWPWRTLTRFSRSQHVWSRISQKRCVLGRKLLENTNRKPYMIYRIVPLSMTWVTSDPDFKVTTFFDIEYLSLLQNKKIIGRLATKGGWPHSTWTADRLFNFNYFSAYGQIDVICTTIPISCEHDFHNLFWWNLKPHFSKNIASLSR